MYLHLCPCAAYKCERAKNMKNQSFKFSHGVLRFQSIPAGTLLILSKLIFLSSFHSKTIVLKLFLSHKRKGLPIFNIKKRKFYKFHRKNITK